MSEEKGTRRESGKRHHTGTVEERHHTRGSGEKSRRDESRQRGTERQSQRYHFCGLWIENKDNKPRRRNDGTTKWRLE